LRMAAEGAAARANEAIGGLLARLAEAAEETSQRSSEALTSLFERLEGDVGASGENLRTALENGARASVAALTTTAERLRGELTQVLERLALTGGALDRTVAGASSRLGEVEETLGERVNDLQQALGGLTAKVGDLDRISGETRADGDRLVDRLGVHSQALSEVARDLASNQQTLDAALGRRQETLRSVVTDVGARSNELERVLREFSAGVERHFAEAQKRAHEISAELAAASQSASDATTQNLEAVRETATRESARTERTLSEAYTQASGQLSRILEEAAHKFQGSVADVKEMAAQVSRELDATRGELKRGVLDLPRETSEATEAVRRVVGDQIKALKELASVVAPAGFDVAEPGAAEPAPPPPHSRLEGVAHREPPPAPLRLSNLEIEAEPAPSAPLAVIVPPAPLPQQPAPDPELAYEPRGGQRPTAPAPSNARTQSGWLSNLLAAASREGDDALPVAPPPALAPQARRPAATGEGLESITTEIARLVDGGAAAEMWDRWRQGETTAVSRRLYTAAGQQAFEDVRRRFRNEPPFRESVTRYLQEFDRLLAKIGQNDRDGAQTRAAMLSDSGKVYMMLAHAAGRFSS